MTIGPKNLLSQKKVYGYRDFWGFSVFFSSCLSIFYGKKHSYDVLCYCQIHVFDSRYIEHYENIYDRGGNRGFSGFEITVFVDIEMYKKIRLVVQSNLVIRNPKIVP